MVAMPTGFCFLQRGEEGCVTGNQVFGEAELSHRKLSEAEN